MILKKPTADLLLQSNEENVEEKRCRESIAADKDLSQDQELGVWVWALRGQIQIYRKPDPERKRGKKSSLF